MLKYASCNGKWKMVNGKWPVWASINTATKLLVDLGAVCATFHDAPVQNVNARRIQIDEIWSFVGSKQKNVPADKQGECGDIWTWTAIDAETKLII